MHLYDLRRVTELEKLRRCRKDWRLELTVEAFILFKPTAQLANKVNNKLNRWREKVAVRGRKNKKKIYSSWFPN